MTRIVVAEDSRTQAVRLKQVLSEAGFDVELASDGEIALAACLASPPAAVITDVLMPKLDGFELCHRLATTPATAGVPVIVLTSLGDTTDVVRALAAGAANFVAKPYDNAELIARVERTIARGRTPRFPLIVAEQIIEAAPRPERMLDVLASALEDAKRRTDEVERARREVATAEAENRRLYEDALRANKAKDEFLAVMSHEVRTPLNAITGWAALLLEGRLDAEKSQRALETIARNARAQARLIDDILDVSRIVAGKITVERRPIELTRLVATTVSSFEPAAAARRVALETKLTDRVSVAGDPDRLSQILSNLVANALKFSKDGARIRIELTRSSEMVELAVHDEGEGIDPVFLPYVFDRFRQADTSSTRKHGGLGLGLSIVRHLVELHGGSIRAESAGLGRGATFRVLFPVLAETSPAARVETESGVPSTSLIGVRVLAVEDDEDGAELLVAILGRTGADALVVRSAAEVTDRIDAFKPDVLVSDIGLPGEDGHALIRRLRDAPATAALPAVALTAFAGRQSERDARAAGFDAHVAKPASPDAIIAAVRRAIALRAAPSRP